MVSLFAVNDSALSWDKAMTTIFVKLGGSLLTDKRERETPRRAVIQRLAQEVQRARTTKPDLRIVLGHGSGSFGHVYARAHGTRAGVATAAQWLGFAQTADAAARLNRIVVAELLAADIPAWSIQPSVMLRCADGRVAAGPESTVLAALARGLLPVVHGDVALDTVRGGTIASTEDIFEAMDHALLPTRIILAGEVGGIYSTDPLADATAALIPSVTPATLAQIRSGLGGSHGVDVTGGMAAKVEQAMGWIRKRPALSVLICSGLEPDNLYHALIGAPNAVGSWLRAE
jgi:isopentenyl phosphate kinase